MILVSHTPDEVVEGVVEGVFEGVLEGLDRYLPGIRGGGGGFLTPEIPPQISRRFLQGSNKYPTSIISRDTSQPTSPDLEEVPTSIEQVSNKYPTSLRRFLRGSTGRGPRADKKQPLQRLPLISDILIFNDSGLPTS
mgnify:CR=1 FL=1